MSQIDYFCIFDCQIRPKVTVVVTLHQRVLSTTLFDQARGNRFLHTQDPAAVDQASQNWNYTGLPKRVFRENAKPHFQGEKPIYASLVNQYNSNFVTPERLIPSTSFRTSSTWGLGLLWELYCNRGLGFLWERVLSAFKVNFECIHITSRL